MYQALENQHLMKSKILSQLRYKIFYIALYLLLLILVLENISMLFVLVPYTIFLFVKFKKIFMYIIAVLLIYGGGLCNFNNKTIDSSTTQLDIEVSKVYKNEEKVSFDGYYNSNLVKVYLSDEMEIVPGNLYTVKGELTQPMKNTYPRGFNYKNYLMSKKIKYSILAEEVVLKKEQVSIKIIPYLIEKYIDKNIPLSKSYVKTFILADKSDFDQKVLQNINYLGVSHLFAVSGLHVGVLVLALTKILGSLRVKEKYIQEVIALLLIMYIVITSFAPSITRATLMYIFLVINKRKGYELSTLDILSSIFILLLISNPFYYYNVGFVLSFIVTLFLIIGKNILSKYSGLSQLFVVGILSFISTFPIVLNLNYQINLLSLLFNIILILLMSYIVLPLSYIIFIFPKFDIILSAFIKMYNDILYSMTTFDYVILSGSFVSIWEIIIYYILVIYMLMKFEQSNSVKNIVLTIYIFIFIVVNSEHLDYTIEVVFLDVVGDSTFIKDSHDACNILIDTGEEDDYDSTIQYLKSKNIKRLDYVIITHFHFDHYGEYDDLSKSFDIGQTISNDNIGDFFGDFKCGNIGGYIYQLTNDYSNENDNSVAISLFIENKHYLFMGDSEIEREKEFIGLFQPDIDYLKVSHHGSITSTSELFLTTVKPEKAFIIVKRNPFDTHPSEIVLNRLQNHDVAIYRTDTLGSIVISYRFGKEKIKYYKPY